MKTREDYDKLIEEMKTKLGENFASVSDIVADLSTDYDSVIQMDKDYQTQIDNLRNEKVKLLETNNSLFSKVINTNKEQIDPNETKNPNEENQPKDEPKIESIISDTGDLE